MAGKEESKGTLIPIKKPKEYKVIQKFIHWMFHLGKIRIKPLHELESYLNEYSKLIDRGEIPNGY